MDARRGKAWLTTLWCLAGLMVAALLWDGAPEPVTAIESRIAQDPSAQEWPPSYEGVVLRPRHGPFP